MTRELNMEKCSQKINLFMFEVLIKIVTMMTRGLNMEKCSQIINQENAPSAENLIRPRANDHWSFWLTVSLRHHHFVPETGLSPGRWNHWAGETENSFKRTSEKQFWRNKLKLKTLGNGRHLQEWSYKSLCGFAIGMGEIQITQWGPTLHLEIKCVEM